MTQPRAAWYPDPSDPSHQRYFDGNAWTENYAPFPAPPPGVGQLAKPAPPKKSKKRWPWALGAISLFVIVFLSSQHPADPPPVAGVTTNAQTAPAKPAKPAGPSVAPAGSSVRDGKFEFQVLGVDRSATKDNGFSTQRAKGEFYVVTVRVTNTGDKAQSFFASNQHLIIDGKKYDATSSLIDNTWMDAINPGLGLEGSVSFDVPKGAEPEAIEFHDSMFSGGARVAL